MVTGGRAIRGRQGGFTLVELMVTVAVLAILLTVAVPGMRGLVVRNSMTSKLNELVGAMQLGRSESIARSRWVSICRSNSGTACGGTGWQDGWILFANSNLDGTFDTGDIVLHTSASASPEFSITGQSDLAVITYLPNGTARGFKINGTPTSGLTGNLVLTVCRGAELKGTVTVDATGRPYGKKEADTTGC